MCCDDIVVDTRNCHKAVHCVVLNIFVHQTFNFAANAHSAIFLGDDL